MRRIVKICLYFAGLLLLVGAFSEETPRRVYGAQEKGDFVLEAEGTPLGEIVADVRRRYGVEITGLEGRKREKLSFSLKGETLEALLKRLFRFLGEANYAFEFNQGKVIRAALLPETQTTFQIRPPPPLKKEAQRGGPEGFGTTVSIKGVVDGSQAQELGLKKGDLIISYGGVRIANTKALVEETKMQSAEEVVLMTVVRDREPMTFHLEGGFIGVHVQTIRILKADLEQYYAAE